MDRRGKTRIALGIVMAAFSVFTALALVSHTISYYWIETFAGEGNDSDLSNWCGKVGSLFAGFLVGYFGTPAAFLTLGLIIFWTWLLLTSREKLPDAWLKLFGSVVLVVTVSALSALAGARTFFPSIVGIVSAEAVTTYFGTLGAYVFLLLLASLSLLLATDFMVVAPAARFLASAGAFLKAAFVKAFMSKAAPAKPAERVPVGRVTRPEASGSSTTVRKPSRAAEDEEDGDEADDLPPAPRKIDLAKRASSASAPEAPAVAAKPALPAPAPKSEPAPARVPEPRADAVPVKTPEPARAPKPRPVIAEKPVEGEGGYVYPPLSLLDEATDSDSASEDMYVQEKAKILEDTLAEFAVTVKVVGIETGPTITQYELELAPGIKVNRVLSLTDDIAMALKAPSVRIVAPIPGRDSVGVEVPNTKKAIVRLRSLMMEQPAEKSGMLPMYLGRDAQGGPLVADLCEMPHLLIAGATGAGKSVCINSIILSVLMKQHPDDVKLLLVDPKMVELSVYKDIPHLLCPVVTDMKQASTILEWGCIQMDNRYDYLAAVNVRHISRYNKLGPKGIRERLNVPPDAQIELPDKIPYIIIIIDELADMMMVAAKDVETYITRLAQKSRAVGIHLVLATQRPSVDVITGLIKSNLPARLSFKVSSRIDSRTILDQNGADKLLGRGDMLFLPPATAKLIRAQGSFVSDDEIRRAIDFVKEKKRPSYDEELVGWNRGSGSGDNGGGGAFGGDGESGERDPLYDQAIQVVVDNQRGSVSLLQRRLEIGYSRAARLIDFMAEDGVLGPYNGSQAREVLYTPADWEDMKKQFKKAR